MKKIWDDSRQFAATSTVNEDQAWQKFQKKIHKTPIRRSNWSWARIAASFIIVAGIGFLAYLLLNDPVEQVAVVAQQEVLIDTIPDGSVVTLNKSSSLSYPSKFNKGSRNVVLKGEAFFNVVADKEKPFIITVNDVQVTVVGTSFNIKSSNGLTEVVVEAGTVRVSRAQTTIELTANEKLTVNASDSVLRKEKVEDQLYKYYRTKEFVCDETPLWKLVQVINEAYNSKVVIGNPVIRDMSITTTFHNESLEQVLNVISITFNIKVSKEGDSFILQ